MFRVLFRRAGFELENRGWKKRMGNKLPTNYDMKGKTVIVTGANNGIGKATALHLMKLGAHVVLACRSKERGGKALDELMLDCPKASAELMLVDLGDFKSIQTFVSNFKEKHSKLHVLINNAGIVNQIYQKGNYGHESMLTVNHLGTVLLTRLLLESLEKVPKEEGAGRVVVVASDAHSFCGSLKDSKLQFNDSKEGSSMGMAETMEQYGFTKLCNILFVRQLVKVLASQKSPVAVFVVHPGWVETGLGADHKGGVVRAIESVVAKTPEEGAHPSVFCACDPSLTDSQLFGTYYSGVNDKGSLKKYAKDDQAAQMLWDWTDKQLAGFLATTQD